MRQALYHAIDRTAIVEALSGGLAPTADSLIPPTHALRRELESAIPHFPYDPPRARRLMADAGWAAPADGTLTHQGTEVMEDVALIPLHWVVEPIAVRGDIRGIRGSLAWNIFDWHHA